MSYEEAIGALCRDTGWPIEYVLGLNGYWRKIMLGWKPIKKIDLTPEQIQAHNLKVLQQMVAGGKRG